MRHLGCLVLLILLASKPQLVAQTPPPFVSPYAAVFDGANIWVTDAGANTVTKIRASDGACVGTCQFNVGASPQGLVFDGTNIWVANNSANTVTKLRANDGASMGTFPVGTNPQDVTFDGANIWITNNFDATVTKLRASDGAPLGTFHLSGSTLDGPVGVLFDGTSIWVASSATGNLVKLRESDGAVLGTFPLPGSGGSCGSLGTCPTPYGLVFDGTNIWVSAKGRGTVIKVRPADGFVLGEFSVGGGPTDMVFDGASIWVTNNSSGTVTRVRASDGVVSSPVTVGSGPLGIAFDLTNLWVVNQASASVMIVPVTATPPPVSELLAPAPVTMNPGPASMVLPGTAVTFAWSTTAGADQYWLDVGTVLQQGNLCAGATTNTSASCSNIPCDGRTIYVQLWTHISGAWQTPREYVYQACSFSPATMISPSPGSTLLGSSATFQWNTGTGADQYWLDVGTVLGQGNICAGATTSLQSTCNNIPVNGNPIYVQLWTHFAGVWQTPIRYTYTAALTPRSQLISPANNSVLPGSSAAFTWSSVSGADQYWLDVGTILGQGNICGGPTSNLSSTCSGIPTNGATIYVQLWTHLSGAWESPLQYTFTAANNPRAQLTSPANHSVFSGSSITFTWSSVSGADQYWLDVGTVLGQGNICGGATPNLSSTCSGIPTNGAPIYVQLWTHISGAWESPIQYTFTAATTPRAQLTSPAANSVFPGSSVAFTWSSVSGADQYWLDVGTALGQGNICGGATPNLSSTCANIPTNGSTIYVQLWTHISGAWESPIQYTFLAAATPRAQLVSPPNNSVLSGSAVTFTWTSVSGADQYWLDVGTSLGHGNICAGATSNLSSTCAGIPTNGSTIYVQLWTHISGAWETPIQYTFTAATTLRAQLAVPLNNSVLSGSSATFTWSPIAGADQYWLDVGTSLGHGNICAGVTTTTSSVCAGLPTNGNTIFVQLWTHMGGSWQTPIQYTFTAFNIFREP